jgi:hypothetical protein
VVVHAPDISIQFELESLGSAGGAEPKLVLSRPSGLNPGYLGLAELEDVVQTPSLVRMITVAHQAPNGTRMSKNANFTLSQ